LIGKSHGILNASYLNEIQIKQDLEENIQKLRNVNHYLIGSSEFPSILGEDNELDKYNFYNICTTFQEIENITDSYSCSGLVKNYDRASTYAFSILKDPKSISFSLYSDWFHLHQLINKYIRLPQKPSTEILEKMLENSIKSY
jgi:myo-inositol-hexaphosphate 3-phosphohydrolase